jgi:hypothetical protein
MTVWRCTPVGAPTLPGMSDEAITVADIRTTGISPTSFPIEHLREVCWQTADGVPIAQTCGHVAMDVGFVLPVLSHIASSQQPRLAPYFSVWKTKRVWRM